MQSADFDRTIRSAWNFLYEEISIGRTVSSIRSLKVNPAFNKVALADASRYQDIYLSAVSLSYYNMMLDDYSILQFSWANEQSWRLAYLPNPWIAGVHGIDEQLQEWEALEALGQLDDEEVASLISELPYFGSVPPIRFEYAAQQYRELSHPAAHLHVGRHTKNRWPLARLLNPLTFSMAITKLYYPDEWASKSAFCNPATPNCVDQQLIRALQNSRLVHDFTVNERRSLHLASQ
jgi:hypothetical protein